MRCLISNLLMAIMTFALVACGPVKVASQKVYNLSPTASDSATMKAQSSRATVLLSTPTTSVALASDRMLYMQTPYQLQAFVDSRWAAPPADMWVLSLADQLRQSNRFRAILTPPFAGSTDYRIDTNILIFQQEFLQPISQMHIAVQVTLSNNSSNAVIASRQFSAIVDAPGNNPYAGVIAANQAIRQINQQVERFVSHAL